MIAFSEAAFKKRHPRSYIWTRTVPVCRVPSAKISTNSQNFSLMRKNPTNSQNFPLTGKIPKKGQNFPPIGEIQTNRQTYPRVGIPRVSIHPDSWADGDRS